MQFFDIPRAKHETRNGTCELPILYRDASQFGVLFWVDLEKARAILGERTGSANHSIEPWPVMGRAIGAIYVWEYRDSTVGSYGEIGLGLQCRRRGSSPSLFKLARDMGAQDDQGIWVLDLPVTTRGAFEAGVDLWGYPKYVKPIRTDFRSKDGASAVLEGEIEISVGKLGWPRMRAQPVVTYTEKNGRLLRTRVDVDHEVSWGGGGSAKLAILGDGPLAKSARALGLDSAKRIATFRTDGFRARLPAGVDLGPARLG